MGLALLGMAAAMVSCSDNESAPEREAKIRDYAAKAVEKIKPELKEAGRDIKAAAEGAKEGWEYVSSNRLRNSNCSRWEDFRVQRHLD